MRYLALDQALKVTGWAIFENGKPLHYSTFSIKPSPSMEKRLLNVLAHLNWLYHDWEFEKIYFEDIQLQAGNALTYKHLAYVQAAIILWCGFNDIPYEMSAPSHWRKVLGGGFGRKREEQKQHAIDVIQEKLGKEVSSDEADALCIGYAAHVESGGEIGFAG